MTDRKSNPNGWNEWSKFVLKELERLNENYEKLDEKLTKLGTKVITQEIKQKGITAFYGILGGAIPVLITIAMYFIFKEINSLSNALI